MSSITQQASRILGASAVFLALGCKENHITQNENTVPDEPACEKGDTTCHGNALWQCKDDLSEYVFLKMCGQGLCKSGEADCGALCEPNELGCTDDDVLRKCDATGDGWKIVKTCKIGTCESQRAECEAPRCTKNEDCEESGVCLPTGDCEAPTVAIKGFVQRYDVLSKQFQEGITVSVDTLPEIKATESTDAGEFALNKVPRGALLDFGLTWKEQNAGVNLVPDVTRTRVSTNSGSEAAKTVYPPVVPFTWMVQVAVDCGLFEDFPAALKGSDGGMNPLWNTRSTIFGEVRDAQGKGVAGIKASDIEIILGKYSNVDKVPVDGDLNPSRVCFLDANPGGTEAIGTTKTESTALGRFVMFRVRNDTKTGFGAAEVRVKGYPPATLFLRGSGNLGVVYIGKDDIPEQRTMPRDFERDIYPLFGSNEGGSLEGGFCRNCHTPTSEDNGGFEQSQERGANGLKADFSGTPDEVYEVLMANDGEDCTNPETPARVCLEKPEASLLLTKPLAEAPPLLPNHQTTTYESTNDPRYYVILDWIRQKAPR